MYSVVLHAPLARQSSVVLSRWAVLFIQLWFGPGMDAKPHVFYKGGKNKIVWTVLTFERTQICTVCDGGIAPFTSFFFRLNALLQQPVMRQKWW